MKVVDFLSMTAAKRRKGAQGGDKGWYQVAWAFLKVSHCTLFLSSFLSNYLQSRAYVAATSTDVTLCGVKRLEKNPWNELVCLVHWYCSEWIALYTRSNLGLSFNMTESWRVHIGEIDRFVIIMVSSWEWRSLGMRARKWLENRRKLLFTLLQAILDSCWQKTLFNLLSVSYKHT